MTQLRARSSCAPGAAPGSCAQPPLATRRPRARVVAPRPAQLALFDASSGSELRRDERLRERSPPCTRRRQRRREVDRPPVYAPLKPALRCEELIVLPLGAGRARPARRARRSPSSSLQPALRVPQLRAQWQLQRQPSQQRHQALRTTRPGRRSRSGRRARRACCVWQHPAALALREPPMRTCRCHALIAAARAQMRSHHRGRRRQESDVEVLTNPNTTIEKSSLTIDKSLCFGNVCPAIGMYHLNVSERSSRQ